MTGSGDMNQINRYCSPYSLLVLTPKKLLRLHCPFMVEALYNSDGIAEGGRYQVGKVLIYEDRKLVYIINSKAYLFSLFRIII